MRIKQNLIKIVFAGALCLSAGCSTLGNVKDYHERFREIPSELKENFFGSPFDDRDYWKELPKNFWRSLFGQNSGTSLGYDVCPCFLDLRHFCTE